MGKKKSIKFNIIWLFNCQSRYNNLTIVNTGIIQQTNLFMSKRCELTGVSPLKGHNVSHSNNKTKRRFLPNLKKVIFKSDKLKRNISLKVTNAAVRSVDFKGGLDQYLKSVKKQKLSRRAQKLKLSISLTA